VIEIFVAGFSFWLGYGLAYIIDHAFTALHRRLV